MELIVISWPKTLKEETGLIAKMFQRDLKRLHVRKPGWGKAEVKSWLEAIPLPYRERLILHSHHELAAELGLGGVHVGHGQRSTMDKGNLEQALSEHRLANRSVSLGIHHLEDMLHWDEWADYFLISPLFDSISKPGYSANTQLDIRPYIQKVDALKIGLGGIDDSKIREVTERGFQGVAVLGYLWKDLSRSLRHFEIIQKACRRIDP